MKVTELNRAQLTALKQDYLANLRDGYVSYYELANIDDFVSDQTIYAVFEGVDFSEDDFGIYEEADKELNEFIYS